MPITNFINIYWRRFYLFFFLKKAWYDMHASDCSVHENFLALTFLYFFWHIHMQRSSLINTLFLSNLSSCFRLFYSMFFLVINMRPDKLHVPRLISLILKIIFYSIFILVINMRPDKLRISRLISLVLKIIFYSMFFLQI
jgi:hypothetical protein